MRRAIVSDIHGNLCALSAVLADAGEMDGLWCLVDIVGLGPEPNECVALLRERSARCVAGDHDRAALGEHFPKFIDRPVLGDSNRWTQHQLTADARTFLATLPRQRIIGAFTLVHTWAADMSMPDGGDFTSFATPYCLVGHSHVPRVESDSARAATVARPGTRLELGAARYKVNPGSVGLAWDTPGYAAYLLYESDEERTGGTMTFRAVAYPLTATVEKARLTMPASLAALWTGFLQ